jgi:hypothetical protein
MELSFQPELIHGLRRLWGRSLQEPALSRGDEMDILDPRVFDAITYREKNTDLSGYDEAGLRVHWTEHGFNEGRTAHSSFNVVHYLALNPDLLAFPDRRHALVQHYLAHGIRENRKAILSRREILLDERVFNAAFYRFMYEEELGTASNEQLQEHWVQVGAMEQRRGSFYFDVKQYCKAYPDLRQGFGCSNTFQLIEHFVTAGKLEARLGALDSHPDVFNPAFYAVQDMPQSLPEALQVHWVRWGLPEGRAASQEFNPKHYLEMYLDVSKSAFCGSSGYACALTHFVLQGRREGRRGVFGADHPSALFQVAARERSAPDSTLAKEAKVVVEFMDTQGLPVTAAVALPCPREAGRTVTIQAGSEQAAFHAFRKALEEANATRAAVLSIPTGTYVFEDPTDPNKNTPHWYIHGAQDLIIEGNGSTLVFPRDHQGININDSKRVLLRNFTIDYRGVNLNAPGQVVDANTVRVPKAGLPYSRTPMAYVVTEFDVSGRQWKTGPTKEIYLWKSERTWEEVEGGEAYLLKSPGSFARFKPGAPVLVRFSDNGAYHAVIVENGPEAWKFSEDISFENVTVLASPSIAFVAESKRGIWMKGVTVTRAPGRWISTNQDGIHLGGLEGDVIVEDCLIEYQGDDGINLKSSSHAISSVAFAAAQGRDELKLKGRFASMSYVQEDVVGIFNTDQGFLGEARVASFCACCGRLELDRHVSHIDSARMVKNLSRNSPRLVVRNNVFRNNRARGMLIQAPNVLIEGNRIEGTTMAAALFCVSGYWMEGASSSNWIFRNNQVVNVGRSFQAGPEGMSEPMERRFALSVYGEHGVEIGLTRTPVHIGFQVVGNHFSDLPGGAIYLSAAADFAVKGNSFERLWQTRPAFKRHPMPGENERPAVAVQDARAGTLSVQPPTGSESGVSAVWIDPTSTKEIELLLPTSTQARAA